MSSGGSSLSRAFEAERGADLTGAATNPEQLDLLRQADGRLPDNVFQLARAEERKRGRKPGSLNRKSTDLARLIGANYTDPVQFQAGIYSMPLDQLCELLLVADGTIGRQRQVDEMLEQLADNVSGLTKAAEKAGVGKDSIERLADACEALEGAARRSQGKPGDVALKALNLQLAAARTVAEYVHSKKPVEAVVRHTADAVLLMPAAQNPGFDAVDETTRMAGDLLAKALAAGQLQASDIAGLKLIDGQLRQAEDAEFEDVPDGEGGAE